MNWPKLSPTDLTRTTSTLDEATYRTAERIIDDVRQRRRTGTPRTGDPIRRPRAPPAASHPARAARRATSIDRRCNALAFTTHGRPHPPLSPQRSARALSDCQLAIPGGIAGHRWLPLESAGCYAPGGRYPLPSSVLMTAITARVAGVNRVWVASPRPTAATLAAAAVPERTGYWRSAERKRSRRWPMESRTWYPVVMSSSARAIVL